MQSSLLDYAFSVLAFYKIVAGLNVNLFYRLLIRMLIQKLILVCLLMDNDSQQYIENQGLGHQH